MKQPTHSVNTKRQFVVSTQNRMKMTRFKVLNVTHNSADSSEIKSGVKPALTSQANINERPNIPPAVKSDVRGKRGKSNTARTPAENGRTSEPSNLQRYKEILKREYIADMNTPQDYTQEDYSPVGNTDTHSYTSVQTEYRTEKREPSSDKLHHGDKKPISSKESKSERTVTGTAQFGGVTYKEAAKRKFVTEGRKKGQIQQGGKQLPASESIKNKAAQISGRLDSESRQPEYRERTEAERTAERIPDKPDLRQVFINREKVNQYREKSAEQERIANSEYNQEYDSTLLTQSQETDEEQRKHALRVHDFKSRFVREQRKVIRREKAANKLEQAYKNASDAVEFGGMVSNASANEDTGKAAADLALVPAAYAAKKTTEAVLDKTPVGNGVNRLVGMGALVAQEYNKGENIGDSTVRAVTAVPSDIAKRAAYKTVREKFIDRDKPNKYRRDMERAARKREMAKQAQQHAMKVKFFKTEKGMETASAGAKAIARKAIAEIQAQGAAIAAKVAAATAGNPYFWIVAAILVLFIILIIVLCSLFSWLSPHSYTLTGHPETVDVSSEEDIYKGYVATVQNYFDVTQLAYWDTYGKWTQQNGHFYQYGSIGDYATYDDYYQYMLNKLWTPIEEQINNSFDQAIQDAIANVRNNFPPSLDISPIIAQITNNINTARQSALQQAKNNLQSQLDSTLPAQYEQLKQQNDDERTSEYIYGYEQNRETKSTSGENGVSDSEEFNEQPVDGINMFGNMQIQTDMSVEELVSLVMLYKTMDFYKSASDGSSYTPNITPDDISEFFSAIEFIEIEAVVDDVNLVKCTDENCKRTATGGDWESGFTWEYTCDGHPSLSGEIKPCKTKDEIITKLLELFDGSTELTESDCNQVLDEYLKEILKNTGGTEHPLNGDYSEADGWYEKENPTSSILSDPSNIWSIDTPIEYKSEQTPEETP